MDDKLIEAPGFYASEIDDRGAFGKPHPEWCFNANAVKGSIRRIVGLVPFQTPLTGYSKQYPCCYHLTPDAARRLAHLLLASADEAEKG